MIVGISIIRSKSAYFINSMQSDRFQVSAMWYIHKYKYFIWWYCVHTPHIGTEIIITEKDLTDTNLKEMFSLIYVVDSPTNSAKAEQNVTEKNAPSKLDK